MKRLAVAYACGVLFALGLAISGMTHPTKVLAFLDFTGAWDPSLALVMASGVLVNVLLFRVAFRRGAPLLTGAFALPDRRSIDARLVGGAALFGVGWGLGGFCPGPAIVSVAGGATAVIVFVLAMLVGMALHDRVAGHRSES
jgi:uncharacterized membrane protein YedE/YeeE